MQKLFTPLCIFIVAVCCIVLPGCNKRKLLMEVMYTIEGWFGSEESKLTVYDMGDSTIAILETKGQKTKQVKLSEAQIPALNAFVLEMGQVPKQDCYSITIENYVVSYFNGIEKIDLTKTINCRQWNGFERLKDALSIPIKNP